MINIKYDRLKKIEIPILVLIYFLLILNMLVFKDSCIAILSAFFGITYTYLAGKGKPNCYLFGLLGSGLYGWLSFMHSLWGNLILYICYYIPMQIIGFVKWKHNLKVNSDEIIKTKLKTKEIIILTLLTLILSIVLIIILYYTKDKNPIIDGITTILSIVGMYLTVKRVIEQWIIWIIVNGLSVIMWLDIAIKGAKVYSTVIMWGTYFVLAIYFYFAWKNELSKNE